MSGSRVGAADLTVSAARRDESADVHRDHHSREHRTARRKRYVDDYGLDRGRRLLQFRAITAAERRCDAAARRNGSGGEHSDTVRRQHLYRELRRKSATGKFVRSATSRRRTRDILDVTRYVEAGGVTTIFAFMNA